MSCDNILSCNKTALLFFAFVYIRTLCAALNVKRPKSIGNEYQYSLQF